MKIKSFLPIFICCLAVGCATQRQAQVQTEPEPQLNIVTVSVEDNVTRQALILPSGDTVWRTIVAGATPEQLAEMGFRQGLDSGSAMAASFTFEGLDGREVSFADFAGKYIYIDAWATWCGPCIQEIPHLERLAEQMAGRDIVFVSISLDRDREVWEKMVRERELGGVQLWAGESSDFADQFQIRGIPRFILIGPDGRVINPSTVRPSNPDIYEIMDGVIEGRFTPEQTLEYTQRGMPKKDIRGMQSAGFTFESIDGGQVSLADLRGNYVLIDIWATWCGPCLREIPHLKVLKERFDGRNITFVAISRDQDKEAWQRMVRERGMGGVQLWCGPEMNDFLSFYRLNGIPRFILLDKEGKIVDDDMRVRPSNPDIIALLEDLEGL
ncbi:MAG: TlpA family protein disulfide reductase [Rikenellaceae bacterium]|nr:TlpA family protein disulfide reductase [Rikenellaceae bacterium]MCL2691930.1 TlpA family protein disulfide reductase [Rikenellaceae bacterium]